jgi:hypothetical protein
VSWIRHNSQKDPLGVSETSDLFRLCISLQSINKKRQQEEEGSHANKHGQDKKNLTPTPSLVYAK